MIVTRRPALLALLLPALVACTPPADTGPDEGAPATPSGTVGEAEATSPGAAPGRIADEDLLGAFELTTSDEETLALQRAFQESVAACMHDAGFEYTPDVVDEVTHDTGPSPAPGEEEEWAGTWGFGISIDMSPLYPDAPPARPDPNAAYVASLSDAGREAYRQALEGTLTEGQKPTGKPGELGCYHASEDDLLTASPPPVVPDLVTELQEQAVVAAHDAMADDPRLVDAIATLADCAADAGATGYDPYAEAGVQYGVGDTMVSPVFSPWSAYEQVSTAWQELSAAGEPSAADLARFQQWERDMAVAEVRCNAPVRTIVDEIDTEARRAVVAPHRAELEDLLATWPNG